MEEIGRAVQPSTSNEPCQLEVPDGCKILFCPHSLNFILDYLGAGAFSIKY